MDEKKRYKLYDRLVELDAYVRKHIAINIPNAQRDIRIHLLDELYDAIKCVVSAGYNQGRIRVKFLVELRVHLAMINMLFEKTRDLDCAADKRFVTASRKLSEIRNIVYGWYVKEAK